MHKDFQILLWHLNFACRVVVSGKVFCRQLYEASPLHLGYQRDKGGSTHVGNVSGEYSAVFLWRQPVQCSMFSPMQSVVSASAYTGRESGVWNSSSRHGWNQE